MHGGVTLVTRRVGASGATAGATTHSGRGDTLMLDVTTYTTVRVSHSTCLPNPAEMPYRARTPHRHVKCLHARLQHQTPRTGPSWLALPSGHHVAVATEPCIGSGCVLVVGWLGRALERQFLADRANELCDRLVNCGAKFLARRRGVGVTRCFAPRRHGWRALPRARAARAAGHAPERHVASTWAHGGGESRAQRASGARNAPARGSRATCRAST